MTVQEMQEFVDTQITDEDILDIWYTLGVPDGATIEDMEELEADDATKTELTGLFIHICALAKVRPEEWNYRRN